MNNKVDPTFIKNLFNEVHNDYCEHFKQFKKRLNIIFKEGLSDQEADNIIDWIVEYKKSIEYSKYTLDEFEEQIKLQRLELTQYRVREIEIFDEVKNAVMPMAIVYWMALNINKPILYE